jgi:hypothetical protein
VSIVTTDYGLNDRGTRVRFLAGAGHPSLLHAVSVGSAPMQPPIQWAQGTLPSDVNRSWREADHSAPSRGVSPVRLHGLVFT